MWFERLLLLPVVSFWTAASSEFMLYSLCLRWFWWMFQFEYFRSLYLVPFLAGSTMFSIRAGRGGCILCIIMACLLSGIGLGTGGLTAIIS